MSRPVTIQNATILEAARELFLERGMTVKTSEIAKRAGVSEGTIFHRFKTKEELFRAAMDASDYVPAWAAKLPERVGKGEFQTQLYEVSMEILEFLRALVPLIMMSWSHTRTGPEMPHFTQGDAPPIRALRRLTGYFEAEMRLKRIARHDPEIVARTLLGAIWNFIFFEMMLPGTHELPMSPEVHLRGVAQLLCLGLQPLNRSGISTKKPIERE